MIRSIILGLGVLIAVSAVLLVLLTLELFRRRKTNYVDSIAYDVKTDDLVNLESERTRSVPLVWAADNEIEWSVPPGEWSSAFIEVELSATALGTLIDPSIETRFGDQTVRHYFERGARGKRLINVSAHMRQASRSGGKLRLEWRHLECAKRNWRLYLIDELTGPAGPMLVLAPHPDDAEIAAFGLISRHPEAWVVTITVGDNGPNHYAAFFPNKTEAYLEKGRFRAWDSLTIPQLAGVSPERIANLGYSDGTLGLMRAEPDRIIPAIRTGESDAARFRRHPFEAGGTPRPTTWRNLVADLEELLRRIRPTAIVTPHPQLDPHADHRGTTLALCEALQRVGLSDGVLWLYSNHAIGTELYPFGPKDGAITLPPMKGKLPYYESIESVPLDSVTRLRKQLAIEAQHDLQLPPLATPLGFWKTVRKALELPYSYIIQPDISYVRRAARPNELFFTVSFGNVPRLLAAYEAERNAAAAK